MADRCRLDGIVDQEGADAAPGQVELEIGDRRYPGREAGTDAVEVVGYQIATIARRAQTNQRLSPIDGLQHAEEFAQRLGIGRRNDAPTPLKQCVVDGGTENFGGHRNGSGRGGL